MRQVRRGAAFRTLRPVEWHPPARLVTLGPSPRPRSTMPASADLLKELRIDRSAPPPVRDANKRWVFIAIGAGLLAVILGAWVALGRDKATEVETAQVTSVGGANGSGAATVLDATGYIVARRMATVSAKITGKVREIKIEEGMHVEAGQVMATLDPIDADAERTLMSSQVGAAQSQIGMVQAQLKEAEANVVRLNGLVKQQLVAKAQYDQAVAERDALRAQLTTAQRNARVAGDRLRIADLSVDNTIVRAPFAGIVIAKAAQPGEIVSPLSAGGGYTRTGIGTIVDMDSLEVEVEVGEAFIGRVKPGMPTADDAQRLSGLEDPRQGHRHHPRRRPRQGHGEGARRHGPEGRAHRPRHGRARELPGSRAAEGRRAAQADGARAGERDRRSRRQRRRVRRRRKTRCSSARSRSAARWATIAKSPTAWPAATPSSSRRPNRSPMAGASSSKKTRSAVTPHTAHTPRSSHVHPRQHPQPAQELPPRSGDRRRPARPRPGHRRGRFRRADGPVGLGQDHAAESHRRARLAVGRRDHGGRPAHRQARLRASCRTGAATTSASSSSSTT